MACLQTAQNALLESSKTYFSDVYVWYQASYSSTMMTCPENKFRLRQVMFEHRVVGKPFPELKVTSDFSSQRLVMSFTDF